MTKQLKKYMAVTTASFMVMQLAACGSATEEDKEEVNSMPSNEENTSVETSYPNEELENEEIYEVPDDMTPEEYANAVMSEQLVDVSDSELANSCGEWMEDEDGSYECLDEDSPYYTQHFFNGLMFATAGAMIGSTMYKSHNRKSGTEKQRIMNSAIVSPNNTRNKENVTNNAGSSGGGSKITTNSNETNSSKTNTNSYNVNSSSSSTNTNGTTSNSSNTYSNGSNSNSSNSYSNNSSSNTGKSGFGSGGGSRGGSSSS